MFTDGQAGELARGAGRRASDASTAWRGRHHRAAERSRRSRAHCPLMLVNNFDLVVDVQHICHLDLESGTRFSM